MRVKYLFLATQLLRGWPILGTIHTNTLLYNQLHTIARYSPEHQATTQPNRVRGHSSAGFPLSHCDLRDEILLRFAHDSGPLSPNAFRTTALRVRGNCAELRTLRRSGTGMPASSRAIFPVSPSKLSGLTTTPRVIFGKNREKRHGSRDPFEKTPRNSRKRGRLPLRRARFSERANQKMPNVPDRNPPPPVLVATGTEGHTERAADWHSICTLCRPVGSFRSFRLTYNSVKGRKI